MDVDKFLQLTYSRVESKELRNLFLSKAGHSLTMSCSKMGIKTIEQLNKEVELIKQNKSKLSKTNRNILLKYMKDSANNL